jgi:hypothetical protein
MDGAEDKLGLSGRIIKVKPKLRDKGAPCVNAAKAALHQNRRNDDYEPLHLFSPEIQTLTTVSTKAVFP